MGYEKPRVTPRFFFFFETSTLLCLLLLWFLLFLMRVSSFCHIIYYFNIKLLTLSHTPLPHTPAPLNLESGLRVHNLRSLRNQSRGISLPLLHTAL